jgi:signal transduction histidine kinase
LLGVASNYLHLLERSRLEDAQQSDVAAARRAIDEAGLLVSRLLAIGRPSDPDAHSDAGEVVATHQALLASSVPNAILFAADIVEPVPVPVEAQDLLQILLNLVSNAVDAVGESGTILVRGGCDAEAGSWVAVSDTGCGMDAPTAAAATTPFFTTKARGVGTGLGLSLVSSIVITSGGVLDVDSEPGCGTTITLRWPRRVVDGGSPIADGATA